MHNKYTAPLYIIILSVLSMFHSSSSADYFPNWFFQSRYNTNANFTLQTSEESYWQTLSVIAWKRTVFVGSIYQAFPKRRHVKCFRDLVPWFSRCWGGRPQSFQPLYNLSFSSTAEWKKKEQARRFTRYWLRHWPDFHVSGSGIKNTILNKEENAYCCFRWIILSVSKKRIGWIKDTLLCMNFFRILSDFACIVWLCLFTFLWFY